MNVCVCVWVCGLIMNFLLSPPAHPAPLQNGKNGGRWDSLYRNHRSNEPETVVHRRNPGSLRRRSVRFRPFFFGSPQTRQVGWEKRDTDASDASDGGIEIEFHKRKVSLSRS
uniref:Putative secreted protein n=1 Tax=Anopheles marajoara TaxID=58244 RepID=A0A2M4C8D9_9DIPT